jgi:adenosylhomocysteine nucleosidase
VRRFGAFLVAAWILVVLAGCSAVPWTPSTAEALGPRIDVAIITVLPEEYHAVLRKLENVRLVMEPDGRPNVYVWATGEIRSAGSETPHRLVVAMAGEAGEVSGALATKATIDRWKPRDVLLVGIAGGIHDSLALGDVVISTQIWGYEHGHLGSRYDTGGVFFFQPTPNLLEAARDLDSGWRERIEVPAPNRIAQSKVVVGKTASGNKVIENTNSDYVAESLLLNSSILGVEMEGAGAGAAIAKDHDTGGTTGFLMIRGISDLVEKKEKKNLTTLDDQRRNPQRDRWKEYASDVAASFAVGLIESNWPE